jgi:2-polyprenyl-3-methyl-5-hydroxy-6-metoxy-1,4-benzoquinol methylase
LPRSDMDFMEHTTWPAWHCPIHRHLLTDMDSRLECPDGEQFIRRMNIPRFAENGRYADAFGLQWKRYRLTQLDSYSGMPITRDRTVRCLGDQLKHNMPGKHVLECGCGAGRFTEILLDLGAYVTSIDLSDAVEANQKNFPQDDRHRIAQADIAALPFTAEQFDVVFCLGVIQHTPNPEATIERLYAQVKPGGTLIIDHYSHSLSWYTKTAPLFRSYLKRLPPSEGIRWTEKLVNAFLPLHKMARYSRAAQMLMSRLSPVLSYYHVHPRLTDALQREWALVDTHDSLTDWYKHARTRKRLIKTLRRLGLEQIWCEYGGNGVEARGVRPASEALTNWR